MRRAVWGILLAIGACGGGVSGDGAVERGDVAWAEGDYERALAEYRLAARGEEDPAVLMRVAHAYTELGRVDEASTVYRTAVTGRPELADQAVADLLWLARQAEGRGDQYGVAQALELASELQPGVGMGDLALPLARHLVRLREFERALPLFQRALGTMPESQTTPVLLEIGLAYEEVGDCERALSFFAQYSGKADRAGRREADWHIGNCAFELGSRLRREGRPEDALRYLSMTLDRGEPRNLLAQAWFDRAEALAELGECTAALEAFSRVVRESTSRASPLVARAEQRIDEIRFGRPGSARPPESRC
ncbi:MAG: tetratricopeptide repeat protein [Gemmatimonadota bacterium]|nr:tetratricopeptide repeat protein [Gemmatimonadota bacterium]